MAAYCLTVCLWSCFALLYSGYTSCAAQTEQHQEPGEGSRKPTPFSHQAEQVEQAHGGDSGPRRLSILLLTFPFPGHLIPMAALGEELARRGHNVTIYSTMMEGSDLPERVAKRSGITYWNAGHDLMTVAEYDESAIEWANYSVVMQAVKVGLQIHAHYCEHGFVKTLDSPLIQSWDIVVIDIAMAGMFMTFACVPQKWNVPFVLLSPNIILLPAQAPHWPHPIMGAEFSDNLSFTQRGVVALVSAFVSLTLEKLTTLFVPFLPETGHGCSSSNMKRYNDYASYFPNIIVSVPGFDFPRPYLPLTEFVGPILSRNVEPLSDELEQWLRNRSTKTIIYISMGTTGLMTRTLAESIVNGIRATKYSAIWSLKASAQHVLANLEIDTQRFFVAEWVPQLSVLQHNSIAMAVLHAGLGGLQEALYNGHPVITIPTSGDQWANAVRVQHYKLGVYLDPSEVNAEKITEAIETISGEEFTGSVAKLQKMFLHAGGVERAADLVEFYEDVGYDHLVPAYAKYEWNWIQYYNVDVYTLMLCIVLLCMYSTCRLCSCVCRRCVGSKEKKD